MEAAAKQISVGLDEEHARRLAELAAERHVEEVELAGQVLAGALDDYAALVDVVPATLRMNSAVWS